MSRSFRKSYILNNIKTNSGLRRFSNSTVRNYNNNIPNGSSYKKIFNYWYFRDHTYQYSLDESVESSIKDGYPPEDGYNYWVKKFYSK